jgi:hypothetical protein
MTAKTEAGANRRSHEMKETVKAKAAANRPSEELEETAKAAAGAIRPSLTNNPRSTRSSSCCRKTDARDAPRRNRSKSESSRPRSEKKDSKESTRHQHSRSEKDQGGRRARNPRSASLGAGREKRNASPVVLEYASERTSLVGLGTRFLKVATTNVVKGLGLDQQTTPVRRACFLTAWLGFSMIQNSLLGELVAWVRTTQILVGCIHWDPLFVGPLALRIT